jgi:predicted nucleic acid-binding protein/antitoxin component of MazEF toxin-antitoxin module
MRVAKWGNSLAVRLPAAVVDALELKEGDEIEIYVADQREFGVSRKPGREELLKRFSRAPSRRPQVRPGRGECPVAFLTPACCCMSASTDPAKADVAEKLIGAGGMISVQVLNEITNVARRKMGMSWSETRAFLSMIRGLLPVEPLTTDIHETGLALAERHGLSIFDAMIAASALHADCDTLWSEDMRDGIVLDDRLRIVNPFRAP